MSEALKPFLAAIRGSVRCLLDNWPDDGVPPELRKAYLYGAVDEAFREAQDGRRRKPAPKKEEAHGTA